VKRIFGAGRETAEEDAGSLTVIATTLDGSDDDGIARAAVETTENVLIKLDADLAAEGVFPAVDMAETRAAGEEDLREPDELEAVRRLREELAGMDPADAAAALRERITSTKSNAELLSGLE
jgi:transcription termination factor Rho